MEKSDPRKKEFKKISIMMEFFQSVDFLRIRDF